MAVISSPVVYNTQTKSKNKWLTVFDASVTLTTDASSSASIRLAEGEQISGRTYVEMFTAQGSAGMFRTRSPRTGIRQGTTVELEHAINDLGDYIVAASIEKEMTLKAALQKVFSYYKGGLWKLGSVDKGTDIKVILDTEYETCMDAINGIMEQVPEMFMSYAYEKSPWSLNIREREKTVTAEGRISRNVKSAVIEMDDSDLCTKVFMKGLGGTDKWGSETDSTAQKKYGTIEKVITGANSTKAIAQSTARSYLKRHKKPRYTITIDAIELSDITGQSLDKFTIGKKCRLALPKYGINVEENITQISWQSIYQNPNSVTVTLSDQEDTVVKHITQQAKATARSVKKVQAKAQKAEETAVASVCTASVANNVLTLKDGNGKVLVNFSKNVALVRVPASNQGWSNGAFTVNATQTNKNTKTGAAETTIVNTIGTELNDLSAGTASASGKNVIVPVTVWYKTTTGSRSTGFTKNVTVNAQAVYDVGYDAGYAAVTVTKVGLAENFSPLNNTATRPTVYIQGTASNGKKKTDQSFLITQQMYGSGNSLYGVELRELKPNSQYDVIGRINIDSVYNAGVSSVTVTSVGLADNYEPLTSTGTRATVYIQGTASNGNKKDNQSFLITQQMYGSGNSLYGVELRQTKPNSQYDVIGRINIDSVYNAGEAAGAASVTVTSVGLADNYSPLTNTGTRYTIYIQGTASNGNKKSDQSFLLTQQMYGTNNDLYGAELRQLKPNSEYDVIGRINIDSVYNAGVTAGTAAGVASVTVTKVGLADNYQPLTNTGTRYTIYIQGTASNGAKKDNQSFLLTQQMYGSNNSLYGVELRELKANSQYDVIGRLNIDSVYNAGVTAGEASVTVTKVSLADNYNPLSSTGTRTTVYIQGTASNGAKKDNQSFTLTRQLYGSDGTTHCVELREIKANSQYDIIGRVSTETVYTEGKDDGVASVKIYSISAPAISNVTKTSATLTVRAGVQSSGGSWTQKDSSTATLSIVKNTSFRPSGASQDVTAYEVKLGSTVILRYVP